MLISQSAERLNIQRNKWCKNKQQFGEECVVVMMFHMPEAQQARFLVFLPRDKFPAQLLHNRRVTAGSLHVLRQISRSKSAST